jgi:ParB family chromosome partitioning protein
LDTVSILEDKQIVSLNVDEITPNPYQPRKFFDRDGLGELSRSIKEYGILQPISVRLINGSRYELVAGERRLRACKMAGVKTIPCVVVSITDQQSAILAIIENLQRQNLNYIEEAEGFQNLILDYSFTQEALAEKIGKSQSTIANKLRILKLPKKIQKVLIENDLSERHARALLSLNNENSQMEVLQKIVKEGLTVKKTEAFIESYKKAENEPVKRNITIKRHIKDIRIFTNTIKQAVDIMVNSGVNTNYDMRETDDGYEIVIKIKP